MPYTTLPCQETSRQCIHATQLKTWAEGCCFQSLTQSVPILRSVSFISAFTRDPALRRRSLQSLCSSQQFQCYQGPLCGSQQAVYVAAYASQQRTWLIHGCDLTQQAECFTHIHSTAVKPSCCVAAAEAAGQSMEAASPQ